MFSPLSIFVVICLYMALLFAMATGFERHQERLTPHYVWIYGLALGVWHTSWGFYGNIGDTAANGFRFLALDLGSYLCLALWWLLVKRMVQVKEAFHITSLADLIAARYNRSQYIAALVSLIALFGSIPYIGLQIKAIIVSIGVISSGPSSSDSQQLTGFATSIILLLFTVLYGIRKLDPTEHHYGMLVVLALECVIKLLAMIAVGLFVTFGLFQGVADIAEKITANNLQHITSFGLEKQGVSSLIAQFIIGFFALLVLPRQFHIAVVENSSQKDIRPAAWIFGGYILLFSVFIVPIAAAGLLQGLPTEQADMFILLLPLQANNTSLTLATFLGGFAAASGMVIITTTAIATMVSNHLVLPLAEHWSRLAWLRGYLLQVRWVIALLVILLAYTFASILAAPYLLASLGSVAITALLQVVPALFGGLFWRRGNTKAALGAMLCGLLIWFYALLLPIMLREYAGLPGLLEFGPANIGWLKPEGLFGFDFLDTTAHGILFSLGVNTLVYVGISLLLDPHKQERNLTDEFMQLFSPETAERQVRPTGLNDYIDFDQKLDEASRLLSNYLNKNKVTVVLQQIMKDLHVSNKKQINIIELVEFHRMIEHELAGSIGAASSHSAMQSYVQYSVKESNELKAIYHHISTELKSTDTQTIGKHDRDKTIDVLQTRIAVLESEIAEREEEIETLHNSLDERYVEIHHLRLQTQKNQQPSDQQLNRQNANRSLSELEQENERLKQMYAELSLDVQRLKELLDQKH
ncbi:MAG: hypothetical protein V7731_16025 [Amphritea sp.]